MVIDSSALVAILLREPDADTFTQAIAAARPRLVGALTYLETAIVMAGRFGPAGPLLVDRLVRDIAADIVAFTASQAERAIAAFLQYGKGRHPAGLNFGDCCSYALAAETGLPLLFKGADFARTDIRPAVRPQCLAAGGSPNRIATTAEESTTITSPRRRPHPTRPD